MALPWATRGRGAHKAPLSVALSNMYGHRSGPPRRTGHFGVPSLAVVNDHATVDLSMLHLI